MCRRRLCGDGDCWRSLVEGCLGVGKRRFGYGWVWSWHFGEWGKCLLRHFLLLPVLGSGNRGISWVVVCRSVDRLKPGRDLALGLTVD